MIGHPRPRRGDDVLDPELQEPFRGFPLEFVALGRATHRPDGDRDRARCGGDKALAGATEVAPDRDEFPPVELPRAGGEHDPLVVHGRVDLHLAGVKAGVDASWYVDITGACHFAAAAGGRRGRVDDDLAAAASRVGVRGWGGGHGDRDRRGRGVVLPVGDRVGEPVGAAEPGVRVVGRGAGPGWVDGAVSRVGERHGAGERQLVAVRVGVVVEHFATVMRSGVSCAVVNVSAAATGGRFGLGCTVIAAVACAVPAEFAAW